MARLDTPAPARPADLLCAAAVVGAVLACSWRFDGAFTAPKLAWASLLSAGACWAVFFGAWRGASPPRRSPQDLALAAYAGAAVLSAWFSMDRPLSVLGHQGFYTYGLLAGALLLGLYLASSRGGSAEDPRAVMRALAYSAGAASVLGLLQWMGVPLLLELSHAMPEGRVYSTLGSPVYLGSLLSLALPVAVRLAAAGGAEAPPAALAAACMVATAAGTQSRAAGLGCAAGLAVWVWASGRAARESARWLKLGAAALVLSGALGYSVWTRSAGRSDSGRVAVWRTALDVAGRRPVLGAGPATFGNAFLRLRGEDALRSLGATSGQTSAHNEPLQVLATMGLVGLGAYLACLGAFVVCARRALAEPSRREDAAAVVAGLAGLFVNILFEPLPLAAAVPAAVLLGTLAPPPSPPRHPRASVLGRLCAALLCTAAAWGGCRLALADYWSKTAHVFHQRGRPDLEGAALRHALTLAPYELKFRMATVKFLIEAAGAQSDPARKLAMAEEARRVSAEGVRLRPGHVDSWKTHGFLLIILARAGTPALWDGAAAVLQRALELDPWFPPLLDQALMAAEARGDAAGAARLKARRARVEELRTR